MTALLAVPAQAAVAWVLPLVGEPGPEPEDVKAGWVAFGIWLGLLAAVIFLSFSMVKRLRNARASQDAGRYGGDAPATVPAASDDDRRAERAGDAEPTGDGGSSGWGGSDGGSDGGGGGGD